MKKANQLCQPFFGCKNQLMHIGLRDSENFTAINFTMPDNDAMTVISCS